MKNSIKKFSVIFLTLAFVAPTLIFADTSSIQAQINALLAQIATLQAQLGSQSGSSTFCHTFNTNLTIGSTGDDVTALQTALYKEFPPTLPGVYVTGTYTEVTASLVSQFQEKYASDILTPNGLVAGTGYVGASTRIKLNALYGCGNSSNQSSNQISITNNSTATLSTNPKTYAGLSSDIPSIFITSPNIPATGGTFSAGSTQTVSWFYADGYGNAVTNFKPSDVKIYLWDTTTYNQTLIQDLGATTQTSMSWFVQVSTLTQGTSSTDKFALLICPSDQAGTQSCLTSHTFTISGSSNSNNAGNVVPNISVSPTSMTFTATQGGSNPASQGFILSGLVSGPTSQAVSWSTSVSGNGSSAVSVSPSTGQLYTPISTGNPNGQTYQNGVVSINTSSLQPGTYISTIVITLNTNGVTSTQTIPITIVINSSTQNTVAPSGTLTAGKNNLLTSSCVVGSDCASVFLSWTSQNSSRNRVYLNGADPVWLSSTNGNSAISSLASSVSSSNTSTNWTFPGPGTYTFCMNGTNSAGTEVNMTPSPCITITATAPVSSAPTASLTVNGLSSPVIYPNTSINYVWSSTNADTGSSTYTVDSNDGCGGNTGTGLPNGFPWIATTPNGSQSALVAKCQAGHTYTITFTASKGGQSANSTLTLHVSNTSSLNSSTTQMANALDSMKATLEQIQKLISQ